MLCVSDSSIYLPLPAKYLLVDYKNSKKNIGQALDLIQTSFNSTVYKDTNKLVEALQAGYMLIQNTGGKIVLFNSSHDVINHVKLFYLPLPAQIKSHDQKSPERGRNLNSD